MATKKKKVETETVAEMTPMKGEIMQEKKGYDEYELEDAVRTLCRAEEIKADKKLMKALTPHLGKKVKAINSVAELRNVAKTKILEEKASAA